MFQKSFNRSSKPGGSRFGGRGRSQGNRGGGKGGFKFTTIHPSKYVQKAQAVEQVVKQEPKHRFHDFHFDPKLQANIEKKGYIMPTPIQDQSIHSIMEKKDLVGIANTGTGKTAAFLLPLLQKVLKDRTQKVLIMAPTRELAVQIHQEFVSFAFGLGITSVSTIGGEPMHRQTMALRRPFNFLIGTPGRIKDLHKRRIFSLQHFNNVVLDEADRMLDMGFIHDIKHILGFLPQVRQSLFFSATISPQIQTLIKTFLRDPVTVSVKIQETSANVEQDIVRVPRDKNKIDVLITMLRQTHFEKVLIFGRTKRGVDRLHKSLVEKGFKVVSIHGNKSQSGRQTALNLFKQNKVQILVATDVAARGLDIPNVSHVINFDQPATYDDYVHRIGRTGRAEKKGIALTFVD